VPDEVLYEEDGSLAYITLNRPEKLNTLNGPLLEGFSQAVDRAAASEAVRASSCAAPGARSAAATTSIPPAPAWRAGLSAPTGAGTRCATTRIWTQREAIN
jgi:hypothetical protein